MLCDNNFYVIIKIARNKVSSTSIWIGLKMLFNFADSIEKMHTRFNDQVARWEGSEDFANLSSSKATEKFKSLMSNIVISLANEIDMSLGLHPEATMHTAEYQFTEHGAHFLEHHYDLLEELRLKFFELIEIPEKERFWFTFTFEQELVETRDQTSRPVDDTIVVKAAFGFESTPIPDVPHLT